MANRKIKKSEAETNNPLAAEKVGKSISKRGGRRPNSGGKRPGSGRRAGVPNKVTSDARAALAKFVNSNAGRMQTWLNKVAKDDPERAFNMVRDLIEYHVPKLARTEHTGKDGERLSVVIQASLLDEKL